MADRRSGSTSVRLLWVDAVGIRRVRAVPQARYQDVSQNGLALTHAAMALLSYADMLAPESGLSAVGEARLVPQDKTRVQLPHYPAHELAICELHKVPGTPWELCPRSALKHVLRQAKDMFGIEVMAGFESEFILLQPKESGNGQPGNLALARAGEQEMVPVDLATYCNSTAFDAMAGVMDEMVAGLEACGIEVEQFHAESAPGQFEISTGPCDAVTAADRLLITREVITGVANKHQLLASFLPKIFPMAAGSGGHVHISIWKDGKNLLEDLNREELHCKGPGASFIAGVLRHLPALLPFTAPSHFSYQRLAPNCWSGAHNIWGWDNKEAPIRMTVPPSGKRNTNFEFKSTDATANPYVALAAMITAGLLGLLKSAVLPAPVQMNPGDLTPSELKAKGFSQLPSSMEEALAALKADTDIQEALDASLGHALVKCLVAVQEAEMKNKPKVSEAIFRF